MRTIQLNPKFQEGADYANQLFEENLDLYLKLVLISLNNCSRELKIPLEYFGTPFSEGVKLRDKDSTSHSRYYLSDLPAGPVSLFGSKLLQAIEEEFKTINVEFEVYIELTKVDYSDYSNSYRPYYDYCGSYIVVSLNYKHDFKFVDFQVALVS